MGKFIDLTGQRFGRLVVLTQADISSSGDARFSCLCDCGMRTVTWAKHLRNGDSKSCGCSRRKEHPTPEGLRHQYVANRLTTCQLADMYGCSRQTVSRWLKKAGVKTRCPQDYPGFKDNIRKAVEASVAQRTPEQKEAFRKAGIPARGKACEKATKKLQEAARVFLRCSVCSVVFETTRWRMNRGRKYCSPACCVIGVVRTKKALRNPPHPKTWEAIRDAL